MAQSQFLRPLNGSNCFLLLPWPSKTTCPFRQQQLRTIKSIQKRQPKISRFNKHPNIPTPGAAYVATLERKMVADTIPLRAGALATKKGMTAVYDPATGQRTPCTVLQMDRVQVIAQKTREKHGYFAVSVGHGWRHPRKVTKAMLGVFANAIKANEGEGLRDGNSGKVGLPPKCDIREFKVRDENGLLPVGQAIEADWFQVGQFVDARARNKGKGFAGGMKRHGFKGQPASHGVSLTHRSMGSAGGSQGSGSRVHPGKKMAGKMGGIMHTVQNLKVLMVDASNGIVVVNGAVSGPKGCLVALQDAKKKPWPVIQPPSPAVEEDQEIQAAVA